LLVVIDRPLKSTRISPLPVPFNIALRSIHSPNEITGKRDRKRRGNAQQEEGKEWRRVRLVLRGDLGCKPSGGKLEGMNRTGVRNESGSKVNVQIFEVSCRAMQYLMQLSMLSKIARWLITLTLCCTTALRVITFAVFRPYSDEIDRYHNPAQVPIPCADRPDYSVLQRSQRSRWFFGVPGSTCRPRGDRVGTASPDRLGGSLPRVEQERADRV
jgi:hypothetical protein